MKKYEIYLPLKYNDGTEIEPEKLKQIRQRLVAVRCHYRQPSYRTVSGHGGTAA